MLFYNCGSQSGLILPPKGYSIMSGNIRGCHTVCYWHLGSLGQDTAKHLTIHRRVPTTKNHSAARAGPRLGNTALEQRLGKQTGVKFGSKALESKPPGATTGT